MANEEHWQRVGHRIQRCDATTGHAVRDVALCDTAETAKRILAAIQGQDRDAVLAYWNRPENRAEAQRLGFYQG